MSKYEIGKTYGSNNSLLVLDKVKVTVGNSEKLKYKVQCQICKHDKELHGNAEYLIYPEYFVNGKLPCGCSKSTRYSEKQWKVIVKRKALHNNHEFVSFVDEKYVDQNTKLILKCNTCSNTWNSCSLINYIRDRGCPTCAELSRIKKHTTSDTEWISRFRNTGFFPDHQYSFERTTPTGRTWSVLCTSCGPSREFLADRANLTAGKIPCDCGSGGGFDVNKTGYFYILKVKVNHEVFLKYGISNFYRRRIVDHLRTLKTVKGEILEKQVFAASGHVVLKIESELKRELPVHNRLLDGFRKESCSLDFYTKILDKVISNLDMKKVIID